MSSKALNLWRENSLIYKSQNTRYQYLQRVAHFVEWSKKDYDELFIYLEKLNINNIKGKMKINGPRNISPAENYIKRYLHDLANNLVIEKTGKKYSASTVHIAYNSIKDFFTTTGLHLDWKLIRDTLPNTEAIGSKTPSNDEIKRIFSFAGSLQNQALIMIAKDTGLRMSDVVRLQWDDFTDDLEKGKKLPEGYWMIKPKKTKKTGRVAKGFIGPESVEVLKLLKEKNGEGKVFPIKANSAVSIIGDIMKRRAGLERLTAHSLRKYFINNMRSAGVPDDYIMLMCGKSLRDKGAYSESRRDVLLKAYMSGYEFLRIRLEMENSKQISQLNKVRSELEYTKQELEQELEKIKKETNGFKEMKRFMGLIGSGKVLVIDKTKLNDDELKDVYRAFASKNKED